MAHGAQVGQVIRAAVDARDAVVDGDGASATPNARGHGSGLGHAPWPTPIRSSAPTTGVACAGHGWTCRQSGTGHTVVTIAGCSNDEGMTSPASARASRLACDSGAGGGWSLRASPSKARRARRVGLGFGVGRHSAECGKDSDHLLVHVMHSGMATPARGARGSSRGAGTDSPTCSSTAFAALTTPLHLGPATEPIVEVARADRGPRRRRLRCAGCPRARRVATAATTPRAAATASPTRTPIADPARRRGRRRQDSTACARNIVVVR
jgi:hypothetical protein